MFKRQSASDSFLMSMNKKHTSKVTAQPPMAKKPPTAKGPVVRTPRPRSQVIK